MPRETWVVHKLKKRENTLQWTHQSMVLTVTTARHSTAPGAGTNKAYDGAEDCVYEAKHKWCC